MSSTRGMRDMSERREEGHMRKVLAIRDNCVELYDTKTECCVAYRIPNITTLDRLIERQQTWTDGMTTFDYPISD